MSVGHFTIQHLGPKGDGTCLGPRGRIFVERSAPGDHIRARVYQGDDGIARGEIVEILEPSRYREHAPCVHYDRCGNCTLQHLTPEFYFRWKTDLVKDAFQKQGLRPRQWLKPIFLGRHNRRRANFTTLKQRSRITMGYYRRRSDELTDIDSCLVADPRILELRNAIKPCLTPILQDNQPTDIFLQVIGSSEVDMVITGPVGRTGEPDAALQKPLAKILETTAVTRISWRYSERDHCEILLYKGNGQVVATFAGLSVSLPPAAFLQPTSEGEQALVNAVLQALPKKPKPRFADLFCGCGTFSGPLLTRVEQGSVDAYDLVPSAVHCLQKAAGKRSLKVFRRDLFRNPLRREEINRYDAVVFDPPRAGCPEQAFAMASARTPILIGVSCNPATFARDARILCEGGYRLQSIQIVDQFLWSHHVEMVGVFTKPKRNS